MVDGTAAAQRDPVRLPRSSGVISRLAYARAEGDGVDLEPILKRAAIARQEIENPHATIRVRDQIEFLKAIATAVEDDLLGFHLARPCDLRGVGLLYYVTASSDTLVDALVRAARYTSIANEGISQRCIDAASFGLSFEYVGVSRHADVHQIEFWMTAVVRICRQLTGRQLVPERVSFVHRRPRNAEMAEFFGDGVEFGADTDQLLFAASCRDLPVVSADPYLNKLLISICEETVESRRRRAGSFRSTVENVVAPLLPHGNAHAGKVARQIGVSQRTLARRLSEESSSFSKLVDELRSDLASRYLADENLTISQIAWLLGYREVASFSHAYRRWTGRTPRAARATSETRLQG